MLLQNIVKSFCKINEIENSKYKRRREKIRSFS